ncbi:MAG: hypothetical protein HFI33_08315 [Lachnospiraceae bacterium]|nr:hypothetical protein [Lachnospiraceae bacterium]
MDLLEQKFDGLEQRMDLLEQKVDRLGQRMDLLDQKVDSMEQHMDLLEHEVTDIKLILENEIRTNISRVAEGHLDLSRNLHEVIRPNTEIEMLSIRVRMLETDMKELKQKIS